MKRRLARLAARVFGLGWWRSRHRLDLTGLPIASGVSTGLLLRTSPYPILTDPPVVAAKDLSLPSDELVLGAERTGEARMYPTSTLQVHHIVNDRLANEPFVITFCLKCFSGLGFDPVVEGLALTFAVSGIYRGAFVMRDDQTGTIWTHLTGEGLAGPLAGRRLAQVPVQMTTFARWLELHPDSVAPDPEVMIGARPGQPSVSREIGPAFAASMTSWDRRLPDRQLVLGVEAAGAPRAYVVDPDRPGPRLLQDELAGIPLVLLGAPGVFPLAFDRTVGDVVVDLRLEGASVLDRLGSSWDDGGRATEGPLAGSSLRFLPSFLTDWYAWAAYHPGSEIADLRPQGAGPP